MSRQPLYLDDLARIILGAVLAVLIFSAGWVIRGRFDTASAIVHQVDAIGRRSAEVLESADSIQTLLHDFCGQVGGSCQ